MLGKEEGSCSDARCLTSTAMVQPYSYFSHLVLRYMFHERRYQKCNIGVYAFNLRAIGLYRHLGFVDEGRLRSVYFSNGEFHDEVLIGMTCQELDQLYPEMHMILNEGDGNNPY